MMRKLLLIGVLIMALLATGCKEFKQQSTSESNLPWKVDQFADLYVMRYEIPDWDSLSLQQKELCYYLSQAALCGRDILWDQNYEHNLAIRHILEAIYEGYTGERMGTNWEAFLVYLKRVWFSNGIHHHYGETKILPEFPISYFQELVNKTPADKFPEELGEASAIISFATPIMFDPTIAAKRVNKDKATDVNEPNDLLLSSATNFYKDVTQDEAQHFYDILQDSVGNDRLAYGMNSQLCKQDGKILERVWKVDGMYSPAIEKIVYWLEKAEKVAETEAQTATIRNLIRFYRSGDLHDFNDYCVQWVKDTAAKVDFVNGFIEDYGDPLGRKCSWEGLVNFKDLAATRRTEIISANAAWFEEHSPIDEAFKRKEVKGITAKVINAVTLGGDCYPTTPIGINLPNANWLRAEYGSKSVTIENITRAYDQVAQGNGFLDEFANSPAEIERARKFGSLSSNLHTDLHECLGHGSGKLALGIVGDELKNYSATLEEARADLFGLYYIRDSKMVELGVLPEGQYSEAEYDAYIRNGLITQLTRIKPGEQIEEAHMRNRALIANWCYEHGKQNEVIAWNVRDGKRYVEVKNYDALRDLFGQLLREIQRIKSTGDFEAGRALVERYAVKVDKDLHTEVLERYRKLNLAPYGGFVNPILEPVMDKDQIVDVKIRYTTDYAGQMMEYGKKFGLLPLHN